MHKVVNNFFQKVPTFLMGINKYNVPLYKAPSAYISALPIVDNIRYLSSGLVDGQPPSTALGASSFHKLVLSSTILVDKSMLIKDIERNQSEVSLFTFPRRWGKTTNLTMLKEFYRLNNNEQEDNFNKKDHDSYKIFAGGTVTLSTQ